jgi:hypothetical protein
MLRTYTRNVLYSFSLYLNVMAYVERITCVSKLLTTGPPATTEQPRSLTALMVASSSPLSVLSFILGVHRPAPFV